MTLGRVMIYESRPFNLYGAQRAILYTVEDLMRKGTDLLVVVPGEGPFTKELSRLHAPFRVTPLPSHLNRYNRSLLHDGWVGRLRTGASLVAYWRAMARLMRQERVQVVYGNDLRSVLLSGPAARLLGIPVVWHMQLMDPSNAFNRIGAFLSKSIIAVSDRDRKNLLLLAPHAHVRVVYNSVDTDRFHPNDRRPQEVKRELGIPEDHRLVGMIGSIEPRKAQLDFLEMAAEMARYHADLTFVLIGGTQPASQSYLQTVQQFIREHGLLGRVILTGYREDVARILGAFDLFVLPSRHEAFPLSILEAMALRIPVVATDVGGVAEMVRHRETGMLVQPGDVPDLTAAVGELLSNDQLRSRCVHNAYYSVLKSYTRTQMTNGILQVLRDCAGEVS